MASSDTINHSGSPNNNKAKAKENVEASLGDHSTEPKKPTFLMKVWTALGLDLGIIIIMAK